MHANEAKPPPYFDYGTTQGSCSVGYIYIPEWDNGRNVLYAIMCKAAGARPAVGYGGPDGAPQGAYLPPISELSPGYSPVGIPRANHSRAHSAVRRAFLDIVVPVYLEFLLTSAQRFFVSHK